MFSIHLHKVVLLIGGMNFGLGAARRFQPKIHTHITQRPSNYSNRQSYRSE